MTFLHVTIKEVRSCCQLARLLHRRPGCKHAIMRPLCFPCIASDLSLLSSSLPQTLRLHPPLILLMRMAKEAFDVTDKDGRTFTIPKGDVTVASPSFQHRLDHVFEEPLKFDPDRFLGERGQKVANFGYIGFGGGRHGCMGETFAYLQIKTIWSVILRQFDFEMIDQFPDPDYEAMVVRGGEPGKLSLCLRCILGLVRDGGECMRFSAGDPRSVA